MDLVTVGWLALQLTGSPFMVGLAAFARAAPLMAVGPFAGIVADRMVRGRVLLAAQSVGLATALALAAIFASRAGGYWPLVALEVVFGAMWALDFPARRTALYTILGASRVAQAVSLETVSMQIAKMLGPLAAGVCLARLGPAASYLVMALVYAAGLLAARGLVGRLGGPGGGAPTSVVAGLRHGRGGVGVRRDAEHARAALGARARAGRGDGDPVGVHRDAAARHAGHRPAGGQRGRAPGLRRERARRPARDHPARGAARAGPPRLSAGSAVAAGRDVAAVDGLPEKVVRAVLPELRDGGDRHDHGVLELALSVALDFPEVDVLDRIAVRVEPDGPPRRVGDLDLPQRRQQLLASFHVTADRLDRLVDPASARVHRLRKVGVDLAQAGAVLLDDATPGGRF